jgi:galactokinase
MGGGFGGCTINIIKEEAIENFIAETAMLLIKSNSVLSRKLM